jgi:hypothetical protein
VVGADLRQRIVFLSTRTLDTACAGVVQEVNPMIMQHHRPNRASGCVAGRGKGVCWEEVIIGVGQQQRVFGSGKGAKARSSTCTAHDCGGS